MNSVRKYLIIGQLYIEREGYMHRVGMTLHDSYGQRKYLNHAERLRFFEATKSKRTDIKLFCQLLHFTGARIAEIHNLTSDSIDFSNKTVILESLKKRKKGIYREIPLPDLILEDLNMYINSLQIETKDCTYLWSFSLRSASRHIKRIMNEVQITGVRSSSRGLRHGFAVYAVARVPLTLVKKWLGHAALETTEIYLNVVGAEEREIAKRIW